MPPALTILAGLVLGLAAGLAIAASGAPWLQPIVPVVEPIGQLFINAIRMTVIPLILSKLVVGVAASPHEGSVRALGVATIAFFVVTLFVAATFGAAVGWPLLGFLPVDADAARALQGSPAASASAAPLPSPGEWIVGFVPANPFQAAAEGAMLPLIVFALAFGVGLLHVGAEARRLVVDLLQAVADVMLKLVQWILVLAPIGVFALAVPLAARMGLAAAGALAFYVLLVAAACTAFALLALYPTAVLLGRMPLGTFARAAAPAQAVAFSSRSSVASLPVMIEQGKHLGVRDEVLAFFLPLAVAIFRGGSVIGTVIGALFVARLYGVELAFVQVATMVPVAVAAILGSPGVPSGAVLMIAPVLAAAGVPPEGFGILLGVDTIPDMFRTTTNITADLAGAAVVDRTTRK